MKNIVERERHGNMILPIQETVIWVRKKQCNASSCMNYLKFPFQSPEYSIEIL